MPSASRRLSGNSGDVRSQRVRGAPSVRPENSSENESMFGSVLPARESTGVSTSSTPRSAKNARSVAYRRARRRSASCVVDAADRGSAPCSREEASRRASSQTSIAEFLRLGELAAGGFAGDDEAGLLRHAAGHLRAERFELRAGFVARHRRQPAGQHDRLARRAGRRPRVAARLPANARRWRATRR